MNLTSSNTIKELLNKIEARPDKRFGQNFLINKGVLEKIIDRSDLKKDDVVLEVGPGLGVLTKEISKKTNKIFLVEKDKKMLDLLNFVLKEEGIENIKIFNSDILDFDLNKMNGKKYKVVANIPYNITSALIRKFLEVENKPEKMILMIQKEVAQRICNKEKASLLSLSVNFYADAKKLFDVSAKSFFPAPKVDSAVIEISPNKNRNLNSKAFFSFLKAGFAFPRKQVLGNLSQKLNLERSVLVEVFKKLNLNVKIRAEDISLDDWIKIFNKLNI